MIYMDMTMKMIMVQGFAIIDGLMDGYGVAQ